METPITYYGGKQRLADKIIKMIPSYKIYCEPFFGGGAVFFKKNKSGLEVVNDLDNNLMNFYLTCQSDFEKLKLKIESSLHSEIMFKYAHEIIKNKIEVNKIEKAWAIWILYNFSFNGTIDGSWSWCNGSSGSHKGITCINKIKKFKHDINDRLQGVQISNRPALKVIKERDSKETFFYLDPPYPGSKQSYNYKFSHKDLSDLLYCLVNIEGKFILSCYWCQTVNFFVKKYDLKYIKIKTYASVANLGYHKRIEKTEVLIYNYEFENLLFN